MSTDGKDRGPSTSRQELGSAVRRWKPRWRAPCWIQGGAGIFPEGLNLYMTYTLKGPEVALQMAMS